MTCFSQYDKCLITPFYDFIGPDEKDALTMPGEFSREELEEVSGHHISMYLNISWKKLAYYHECCSLRGSRPIY